ncbi:YbaB/EbfC family nucleoid-associated protein [Actinoplanes sp. NPDC024001]|uniref:YbaB/EbfC family nucleoid-associated protein n=1 Tax=Actinoplanes sp. NPDC024001 TaxID=3154598 RepID=UPI003400AC20
MTAGFLDADDAENYLHDWKARIDRKAADTRAMSDRLADLRVTAADGNGIAEVTVDSAGVLTGVRFTDRVQRVAPEATARAVLAAHQAARRKAGEHTRQIIADTMGADSLAGRAIAERLEK